MKPAISSESLQKKCLCLLMSLTTRPARSTAVFVAPPKGYFNFSSTEPECSTREPAGDDATTGVCASHRTRAAQS